MIVKLLAPRVSNRLRFTLDFVFQRLGLEYVVITNSEQKDSFTISYGFDDKGDIPSIGLLFEDGIRNVPLNVKGSGKDMQLFAVEEEGLGFDFFSAVFFFISRYEEYIGAESEFDEYGRFMGCHSIAHKRDALRVPIVDIWINLFYDYMKSRFDSLPSMPETFPIFQPTFDIDHLFAFKARPLLSKVFKLLAGLKRGGLREFVYRWKVLSGKLKDPYDTFEYIENVHRNNRNPLFFLLVGSYGGLDTAISMYRREARSKIEEIKKIGSLGLHPSVHSVHHPTFLKDELKEMAKFNSKNIDAVRQHYLHINMPKTLHNYWEQGVKSDYSMAFADQPGFRLGTCHPVNFYNLQNDRETNLKLFPSCVMDGTLRFYLKCSREEAKNIINQLMKEVKLFGGFFIPIWHNNSLSDYSEWQGWREVYDHLLKEWNEV